jgi:hypothetical protein
MILDILERSRATPAFREAVAHFLESRRSNDRIIFEARNPAVKVERTLKKALLEYPDLAVESIDIRAVSGCESFRGELTLHAEGAPLTIAFDWDCKWRAEQEGWRDWFGLPDQARAAREFDHDCFRNWRAAPLVPGTVPADEQIAVATA